MNKRQEAVELLKQISGTWCPVEYCARDEENNRVNRGVDMTFVDDIIDVIGGGGTSVEAVASVSLEEAEAIAEEAEANSRIECDCDPEWDWKAITLYDGKIEDRLYVPSQGW